MLLKRLTTGDKVFQEENVIRIEFAGRRNVLSTCAWNGGYREELKNVFNYDSSHGKTIMSTMKAPTLKEHMKLTARELGFDPVTTTGMCTAAQMKNVSIREMSHEEVTVTAIVTGGIDVNGGRAGDPASWYEKDGGFEIIDYVRKSERERDEEGVSRPAEESAPDPTGGTINIMLSIDARMSESVLAAALMTVTEAKAAAIQELLLPSRYSRGIATGSGTDKVIIIGNPSSKILLSDAGKHSLLGEMIGKTVILAVREALDKQTDANPKTQHSVLSRMGRFGMTWENIWKLLSDVKKAGVHTDEYLEERIRAADGKSEMVVAASIYAHLLDQLDWGLLEADEVLEACGRITESIGADAVRNGDCHKQGSRVIGTISRSDRTGISPASGKDADEMITELAIRFEEAFASWVFRDAENEIQKTEK